MFHDARQIPYLCKSDLHSRTMPRAGVAYDSYELADIEDPALPDHYKVYVFANAFTLSDARRAAIKRRVRRAGKTAVWFYAPGYFRAGGRGGVENVTELTGVTVRETFPVPESDTSAATLQGRLARVFAAEGPNVCERDGWRSVYYPLPPGPDELRRVFAAAGAHVWLDTPDVLAAGRGYVMVHASTAGAKTIRLPERCDVREIFGAVPARVSVTSFTDTFTPGVTRVYHLTPSTP